MKKIFFYALSLMCSVSAQAAVITYSYDGSKTAAENGTALQAAITAAESGDELKVQAGTYVGNFTMKEGVNVSGGWDANFETQTDYATILDANASGRVVNQEAAFTTLTIWSNLTIQNGNVTGTGGGVILCKNGQLNHCKVMNNTCTTQGGGIYCDDSSAGVIIDDCIVSGNTANQGGGMRIRGTVQNSIVENNTITDAGGGIHLQGATAINCIVRNNTAKAGAGIRAYGGTVKNCIIENNSTTTSNTGGVFLQVGAQMTNSIIRNNTSGENTGGVRMTYDSNKSCTMANCLIVGNSAAQTIGGMSLEGGAHNVYNNTFIGNKQTSSGNPTRCGVRLNVGASLLFCNNIVWGNSANNVVQNSQMEINTNYISNKAEFFRNNAIVYASEFGTNTILLSADTDPGFVNAAEGDYGLLWTSALVDAGNNSDAQGTTDLAGNARKAGNHVDIGAYELPYVTLTIADFDHATLTVGETPTVAGEYPLPMGYTTTATIVAEEGYNIQSVTCGDAVLVADEGIYTLPALLTDMTLTITVEKSTATGINDANTTTKTVKVIRNGQLFIIRDGKTYNTIGQTVQQ